MKGWLTNGIAALTLAAGSALGQVLPTDPPPTSPQLVLPKPVRAFPLPSNPQESSPTLAEVSPSLASHPLTLQEAVSVALALNPVLAQAGQTLYLAQGRVSEAQSAFYPTLSLGPSEAYIRRIAAPAYGIQATLPLDISHMLAAAADQAHFQEVQARLDVNRTRNDVVYRVASSFFAALRSQALLKVSTENLQNSLDRQYDAEARYSVRAVAYLDVLRAQTDVATAQRDVIGAQSSVRNSLSVLANAIGLKVDEPLRLNESGSVEEPPNVAPPATALPAAVPPPPIPPRPDGKAVELAAQSQEALALGPEYQSVLGEALSTRPEILEADAGIAAARKGVLVARRSELPSLSVGAGYYDLRTQSGSLVNEPQAFLGLTIPIFDAGLARARVQEAQATVSNAITSRREQLDAVTLDVQQAYLSTVQAREQVAVANQAVVQARTAFGLARVRYNAGVSSRAGISPLLEVSDAQAALTLAEQNEVNALYDYNAARTQLDRSAGRFAFFPAGPGYAAPPGASTTGAARK